ncbi:MAG: DUF3256 family protein [Paraprevotella sp.]|nr:DUF3256 family protein [Paraprevotella sp.]
MTSIYNKRKVLLLACAALSISASAQMRMRDVFAQLPDSVLPYMTRNNRLDCIDFIENGIEARVKNRFDQHVVLDSLTEDYLRIQTSTSSYVEMKLVPQAQGNDTSICVNRTYMGTTPDSEVKLYDKNWALLRRIHRPAVSEFLKLPACDSTITTEAATDTMRMLRQEAEFLPLMKATLSSGSTEITWTLQTSEFTKEQKKVAEKYLQPVVKEAR